MLKLDKHWTISADENNFNLSMRRPVTKEVTLKNKDTGEKYKQTQEVIQKEDFFYPNLQLCLETYLREKIREEIAGDELLDAKSIIDKISEVHKDIADKLKTTLK